MFAIFLYGKVDGLGASMLVVNTNPSNVFATLRVLGGNSGGGVVVIRGNLPIRGERYPGTGANGYMGYGPSYGVAANFSNTNTFSSNGLSLDYRINKGLPSLVKRRFTRRVVRCASKVCLSFNTSGGIRNMNRSRGVGTVELHTVRTKLGLISYPVHRLNARVTRRLCKGVRGRLASGNIRVVFGARYISLVIRSNETGNTMFLPYNGPRDRGFSISTSGMIVTANEGNTS